MIISRYHSAVEEIGMDGSVSLGECSASTYYRWARECNEILEREKADWRVKAVPKEKLLILVPLPGQKGA